MAGMNIDFNNVRRQAIKSYDRLCEKLNNSLDEGFIHCDSDYIQKEMDELRQMIGAIAMTYEPDSEEFKDVYSEIFPIDSEKRMQSFNDNED